ncbi:hypothetical protein F2Q70_00025421 [Brassica cretica]|uniref:Uncharacterized protein n=1 Tax=Brassica cretica TaxID=69181 RepID=A0A8S9LFY9_BRACR|nr:hypothetical protein F2Q70_00025421 [Brassica cretica]
MLQNRKFGWVLSAQLKWLGLNQELLFNLGFEPRERRVRHWWRSSTWELGPLIEEKLGKQRSHRELRARHRGITVWNEQRRSWRRSLAATVNTRWSKDSPEKLDLELSCCGLLTNRASVGRSRQRVTIAE